MTFGGTQDSGGELLLVADVFVRPSVPPDHEPKTHGEFDVEVWQEMIGGPNRMHVLVMSRALLEDFVKQARVVLKDQG